MLINLFLAQIGQSSISGNLAIRGAAGGQLASIQEGSEIGGSLTIALGGGEDIAILDTSTVNGVANIITGSGEDNVTIADSTLNSVLNVSLGGSNDVFLTGNEDSFGAPINVDGGNGSADQAMVTAQIFGGAAFDNIEQLDIFPLPPM